MSTHKSTKGKRGGHVVLPDDHQSLVRFADLLKLRSLAHSTRAEYLRYVRRLGAQAGVDPATLSEEAVRAHILKLKTAHAYSPSSMRTAVAAFTAFFNLHLGNAWALFGLIRCPDRQTLPMVLTREQVAALLAVVRDVAQEREDGRVADSARSVAEGGRRGCPHGGRRRIHERFRTLFGLIYACGLRVSEAVNLRVRDIEADGTRVRVRDAKGGKTRLVPLPRYALQELRAYWKTHRHPTLLCLFHRRPRAGTRSVTPSRCSGATPAA